MPEMTPPKFVVMKVPFIAEERFIILDAAAMASHFRPFAEPGSTEDRLAKMLRGLETQPQLAEDEVRARLTARGEPPSEIERWFERARKAVELAVSTPAIAIETITRIGYRNAEGQEVVRKTEQSGPDHQRVFMMRCAVCSHEYGSYGCDADIRRCPACQDGAPAVAY